jgi:GT2 family glycosyltransferase
VISAIVVNWNGREYLGRCLGALQDQARVDEILLVDNHSEDGSREMVAEMFPDVRIIDIGANLGPAHARNVGVAQARNDLCLLLDNDVVLQEGAVARLEEALTATPRAAMAQARSLCGDEPNRVHYDSADLHFLGTLVLHNWYLPLAEASRPNGPVGAGIALCFLTRKSLYQEVGGFNKSLFILYEDNEFSYKLRMRGYTIHLVADAICVHLGGTAGLSVRGANAEYPARRTYLHSRNRWYVLLTCMRWRTFFLTMPAQLLYGLVYAVFGHQRGHMREWWMGKWALLKMIPDALRCRKAAQRGRTVADRELLVAAPLTLNPGLVDSTLSRWVRGFMNRFFSTYWRIVRGLCG